MGTGTSRTPGEQSGGPVEMPPGLENNGWTTGPESPTPARPQAVMLGSLEAFIEEPIWKTLKVSVQDLFAPKKLPPLQLTSQPIAVVDRMKVKRSPMSSALSAIIHAVVIGLILLFVLAQWRTREIQRRLQATEVSTVPFIPPSPMKDSMGGGGGGGNHETVEASKGKLPPMEKHPLAPPQILKVDNPKIPVTPAIMMPQQIKLPDNPNMPNFGMQNSPNVTLASQGGGSGSGFGSGSGGGIGSGNGNGLGPGEGGGYGGGLMHLGGGVSAPVLIYDPDPEFSDEARRAKYQGVCVVGLIVDAQGNPQQVKVVRPLGMGLDEKALIAVRQYKFKPAMYKGKAVPVEINIEVNFRIY